MKHALEFRGVTKRFGKKVALDDVNLLVPERSIIGLVGRNGSGKTTLLRHITGLYLPTSGECTTLGCASRDLGPKELSQIGMMNQHDTFIEWMKVGQFLRYIAAFYAEWDRELEAHLVSSLDIDVSAKVGKLSPGNAQKVGLVAATCHHPRLLLLDEPLSDLDPIVRARAVSILLERFSDDNLTMIISSHLLHDIERVVDRVVCLEAGKIVADDTLDHLKESYAEWIVSSPSGQLPQRYEEPFILRAEGDAYQARLEVRSLERDAKTFAHDYSATVDVRPLNLERIFPLLIGASEPAVARSTIGQAEVMERC
jgi:ABC-type multidrug transport system, ATPase component